MLYIVTFLACLFASPFMNAETIGKVEYQLPEAASDWKVMNEMKNETGTTVLYAPENFVERQEFFGVNHNNKPSGPMDADSIADTLKKMLPPTSDVNVKILEQTPQATLFEVSVKDKDKNEEIIHAWSRFFSVNGETVVLTYQTGQVKDIDNARQIWLPILRNAKVVDKKTS